MSCHPRLPRSFRAAPERERFQHLCPRNGACSRQHCRETARSCVSIPPRTAAVFQNADVTKRCFATMLTQTRSVSRTQVLNATLRFRGFAKPRRFASALSCLSSSFRAAPDVARAEIEGKQRARTSKRAPPTSGRLHAPPLPQQVFVLHVNPSRSVRGYVTWW